MTLDHLKEELLEEARKEADATVRQAEEEARRIVEEERKQKAAHRKQLEEELDQNLGAHHQERLAWAHLEARRILAEAREDSVKASLDDLCEMLQTKKDAGYASFLNKTLQNGIHEIGGECVVHLLREDRRKIKAVGGVPIQTNLSGSLGGLMVETRNGKIRFNGTLEARLESLHEELRKRMYGKLFGIKQEGRGMKVEARGRKLEGRR